jgi:hypothetical protein
MKAKGRPILGAFSGFFGFLFLAIDLVLFGVIHFNSPLVSILPVIGLVLGILFGFWAPIGAGKVERQVAEQKAIERREKAEAALAPMPQPAPMVETVSPAAAAGAPSTAPAVEAPPTVVEEQARQAPPPPPPPPA